MEKFRTEIKNVPIKTLSFFTGKYCDVGTIHIMFTELVPAVERRRKTCIAYLTLHTSDVADTSDKESEEKSSLEK